MLSLSPRVAIVGACLCWALGTILSKTLLSSFPPVTILVFQLTPSVIALWLAVVFTKPDIPAARLLLPIGLLGLLNPGWAYTFSMFGLAETSASIATLLWAFEPILILGLAWIFLRERIDGQLAGLVALAASGVFLISGLLTGEPSSRTNLGTALILAGVLCCAIYTVLARNLTASPLFTVAIQQTVALSWMIIIWTLELYAITARDVAAVPIQDVATIVLSGLLYYALAYWLYLHALRSMPASVAGSFFSLIPVFGVVGSFLFLGERLTPPQWLGALLIIGAVMMVLRRNIVEPSIELAGRMTAIRRSQTLSMLDERQLDDIGLTRKQASELDKRNADRRKP
ncbi:drug/metabolite transporter (DMT)-like permease [Ensifer sp. KUDG1]|uniref:EamA family transporter n=1 Tax=Ensifer sp. KUDG1 TaxID=3373919 RepID=UPI003D253227